MSAIDISAVIGHPPHPTEPLSVTFPCGVEVAAQYPSLAVPDGASMAKQLLGQVNAALAPLNPILKVVDLAVVIVDALKAVPEIITNPGKLIELLTRAVKAKDLLLKLLPPTSVPIMAVQLLDVLIAYLEGIDGLLDSLVLYEAQIAQMQAQAAQYPSLLVVVSVAEEGVTTQMQALDYGAGPIAKLVRAFNLLMGLASLPQIPAFDDLGTDPVAAKAVVATGLQRLRDLRAFIPI